jgi:hypothetical protein
MDRHWIGPTGRLYGSSGRFSQTTGDANKSRIRLKYSAGANDANGYKHARQFTYGIELTTGGTPSGK